MSTCRRIWSPRLWRWWIWEGRLGRRLLCIGRSWEACTDFRAIFCFYRAIWAPKLLVEAKQPKRVVRCFWWRMRCSVRCRGLSDWNPFLVWDEYNNKDWLFQGLSRMSWTTVCAIIDWKVSQICRVSVQSLLPFILRYSRQVWQKSSPLLVNKSNERGGVRLQWPSSCQAEIILVFSGELWEFVETRFFLVRFIIAIPREGANLSASPSQTHEIPDSASRKPVNTQSLYSTTTDPPKAYSLL